MKAFTSIRMLVVFALAPLVVAAASPSVFTKTQGGLWQVDRAGAKPVRLCLASTEQLALFEHRQSSCNPTTIRDSGSVATIRYTCAGGDFGRSDLTLLTPRSMRIATQGISGNAPFNYVLQAHRVGDCPAH